MKKPYYTKSERIILLDDTSMGALYRFQFAKLKLRQVLAKRLKQIACAYSHHRFQKINERLYLADGYGCNTCKNCGKRLYFDL
ncbi:MAG: hypothetical protein V4547_16275 [Bacteroidota bacterium]